MLLLLKIKFDLKTLSNKFLAKTKINFYWELMSYYLTIWPLKPFLNIDNNNLNVLFKVFFLEGRLKPVK